MARNNQPILVPVDFSEQSLIAVEQACNVARINNASLILIHVLEESFFSMSFFSSSDKVKKDLEKKAEQELLKLKKQLEIGGLQVSTINKSGKVYEEISVAAKSNKCSLIIMGTNGSIGIKKFIGSNALRVVKEAPCPVITIKGKKHRKGCDNILLPIDLTKETKEKVAKAIEFAKTYNSTIHLANIVNTTDEFLINKLQRQVAQVKNYIDQQEINTTVEALVTDDAPKDIIKFSKKINADLIMIMTQEEMDWTDMFIGSDAQQIINDADIPVLSIKPSKKKYADIFSM
ncbi:MAG: hypothetical protein RIQ89_415 [Bacteroidota bacterium]|jgi:nucleotide-binding universal stress UspA family protein